MIKKLRLPTILFLIIAFPVLVTFLGFLLIWLIPSLRSFEVPKDIIARPSTPYTMIGSSDFELVNDQMNDLWLWKNAVGMLAVRYTDETEVLILSSSSSLSSLYFYLPFCTGVRVGKNLILTANHCLTNLPPTKGEVVFLAGLTANTKTQNENLKWIVFGNYLRLVFSDDEGNSQDFFQRIDPHLIVPVHFPVLKRNQKLDVAILQADFPPIMIHDGYFSLTINQVANKRPSLKKEGSEQEALLLGYPHGVPLVKSHSCLTWKISQTELRHNCDSLSGHSGGLILDQKTLLPLGLHVQGPGMNQASFYLQHHHFENEKDWALLKSGRKTFPHFPSKKESENWIRYWGWNKGISWQAIVSVFDGRDMANKKRKEI